MNRLALEEPKYERNVLSLKARLLDASEWDPATGGVIAPTNNDLHQYGGTTLIKIIKQR